MSTTTATGTRTIVLQRLLAIGVGGVIALIGFWIGNTSYQVVYQQVPDAQVEHYISGDASNNHKSYMQLQGSNVLFIVNEGDLSPQFSANALGDGNVSLVYRQDQSEDIDVTGTSGTHLKGKAFTVIAITVLGSQQQVFATDAYARDPNGFYEDRWTLGRILIGIGAAVALLSLFVGERILVVLYTALSGAVVGPVLYFVFVGVFEIGGSSGESWQEAGKDNLILLLVLAGIGLIIGFFVGIWRAVVGED